MIEIEYDDVALVAIDARILREMSEDEPTVTFRVFQVKCVTACVVRVLRAPIVLPHIC